MLFLLALLLPQDDVARDIDALGSERLEEREAATRRLKAKGVDILPALRANAEHTDPEVATRVRALLRLFEIRASFSPRLKELLPGLDERLSTGPPAEWTKALLAAAELDAADLDPLAAAAVRGASTPAELNAVCAAVEKHRLRTAFPALVEWIQARKRIPASMASALAAIGDPAAVPLLLDLPILPDGCVAMERAGYVIRFGASAHPELRRRLIAWKAELDTRTSGLYTAFAILGDADLKEIDPSLLDFFRHLSAAMTTEHDYLLGRVAAALYPRHRAEVVGSLDAALKHPRRLGCIFFSLEQRAKEDVARLWPEIWARTRDRKDVEPETRQEILDGLWRLAPETLWLDPTPLRVTPEALAVIQSLRYHDKAPEERRAAGLARVLTYLKAAPEPDVVLALASYHDERGEDRLAEPHFHAARAHFKDGSAFRYGEILMRLGRAEEAEPFFRRVLPGAKALGLSSEGVQARLDFIAGLPRRSLVRWRPGPFIKAPWVSIVERAGDRVFYLGPEDVLRVIDPFSGQDELVANAGKLRDFMPLDARRAAAALDDGRLELREAGKPEALWSRPLSLGLRSSLSASPRLVTAAAEDGTFHAIDPATGRDLWTRRVENQPWPVRPDRVERVRALQTADRVLVPLSRDTLELVELASGESRGRLPLGFAPTRSAAAGDALIFFGAGGDYAAFRSRDGEALWNGRFDAPDDSSPSQDVAVSADGSKAFLVLNGELRALAVADGRRLWDWRWTPPTGEERPRCTLRAAPDGLYCVVNWRVSRDFRSELILFAPESKIVFRCGFLADPAERSNFAAFPLVVDGHIAVFRKQWEIWERPGAAGPPVDRR